jgi:hypothetical protein
MAPESRDGSGINRMELQINYAECRRPEMERCRSHIPDPTFYIQNEAYSGLGDKGMKTPSAWRGSFTAPDTTT